jgi:hypothetical protein
MIKENYLKLTAVFFAIITLLWIIFLALTPVISRDALILHMAFPKLWAKESFLYFQDHNLSTVSMMNLDYIYMLLFKYFSWEGLPKILHASLLISSAFFLYLFLKKRFGWLNAFIFSIIFITIPINQRLASEAYVDLGVLFFSTLAIIYFIKFAESDWINTKYLIFSAVFSGLSVGTKYSGAILPAVIVLIIGFTVAKKENSSLKAFKYMIVFSLIVLFLMSPWLLRSYLAVGNPFYPLLNSIFTPDIISPATNLQVPANEYITRSMYGESLLDLASIPFRMFFSGTDGDLIGGFDGVLNPMLLLLFVPLLFVKLRKLSAYRSVIELLSAVFVLTFAFFLIYGHLRIRYFIYSIPLLIILNAYFVDILKKKLQRKYYLAASVFIFSVFLFFNIKYSHELMKYLDTLSYIIESETKEEYLLRKLPEYEVAQKINKYTPVNAVIYEALCGHRTYYIERPVVFDDFFLDRYLYNFIDSEAETADYLNHFDNLPFKTYKKADYLMIKKDGFLETYKKAFSLLHSDSLINERIRKFQTFLESQPLLYYKDGIYIYQLIKK